MQVCSGDWGGPAQANTARTTLPLPSKHQFQCLEGTKKESVLGEEMVFGGEAKTQHAPGGCRGVGRDMANISPKFGVVRLSVRCRGQVGVKVTQSHKTEIGQNEKIRQKEKEELGPPYTVKN